MQHPNGDICGVWGQEDCAAPQWGQMWGIGWGRRAVLHPNGDRCGYGVGQEDCAAPQWGQM